MEEGVRVWPVWPGVHMADRRAREPVHHGALWQRLELKPRRGASGQQTRCR